MLIFKKRKRENLRTRPTFKGVLTAFFATVAAIFLLLLAGISLAGTAVAFIATMPLFLVFSPVLVPAGITTTLLATGLAASGGSGATALTIFMWLYKQLTGKDPPKIPGLTPDADGSPGASPGGSPGDSSSGSPGASSPSDSSGAPPGGSPSDSPGASPGGSSEDMSGGMPMQPATAEEKPASKPAAKPPAKLAAKPKSKPAAKPAAKPKAKSKAKPAAKPAAKPKAKPAAKPK
ncbi:oleosin-B1 [Eutrema salsugineum]|nr:oleosin-B1 [Eutrema salsugineum]